MQGRFRVYNINTLPIVLALRSYIMLNCASIIGAYTSLIYTKPCCAVYCTIDGYIQHFFSRCFDIYIIYVSGFKLCVLIDTLSYTIVISTM